MTINFVNKTIYGNSFEYLLFSCFSEKDIHLTWITKGYFAENKMRYRKQGASNWVEAVASSSSYFPTPKKAHMIHKKRINGLESDSVYEVEVLGTIKTIKTPPTDNLKVAFFSDNHNTLPKRTETVSIFNQIKNQNADIVISGGDLTSQDGKRSARSTDVWLGMLEDIQNNFKKGEHLIPFLVIPGNHEFTPFYSTDPSYKYYFDDLFEWSAGENKFYGSCRIGNKLNILLLDSAHATSIQEQETFIKSELQTSYNHVLPIMHVSPYQSSRARQDAISDDILVYWMPHFHDKGVKVILDGHSHARKRTVKVKNDQPDPNGIIFCGDGASSYLRNPYSVSDTWFLDNAARENSFWTVDINESGMMVKAINISGAVVDQFTV